MRNITSSSLKLVLLAGAVSLAGLAASPQDPVKLERSRTEFNITLDLPLAEAAPLFGGWGERAWMPGWDPRFIHPAPPRDQAGAVFTAEFGGQKIVFMTTEFDVAHGRIQHVIFFQNQHVAKLDITLTRKGGAKTQVSVLFERTALTPEANQEVNALRQVDAQEGQRWQGLLQGYLAKRNQK